MDARVSEGKHSQMGRLELNFIPCETFFSLSSGNYGITKKFTQNCDLFWKKVSGNSILSKGKMIE